MFLQQPFDGHYAPFFGLQHHCFSTYLKLFSLQLQLSPPHPLQYNSLPYRCSLGVVELQVSMLSLQISGLEIPETQLSFRETLQNRLASILMFEGCGFYTEP